MKKIRLLFVVLILVTLTSINVPVKSDGSGIFSLAKVYWGTAQQLEVSPGDVATLSVFIRYEGWSTIRNLEANLTLPDGFKAEGGGNTATFYFTGTATQGSLLQLEFPIVIGTDLEKGNYTATLELYSGSDIASPQDELQVMLEVTGKPNILVTVLEGNLHEGRQQATLMLHNSGDATSRNLKIDKVRSSSASTELEPRDLGDLASDKNFTLPLSIFIPSGMSGKILSIDVQLSYLGPKNIAYINSENLLVPIRQYNPPPPLKLTVETRELRIGKNSSLSLNILNKGSYSLSEIMLALSPDSNLRIFGSTILYIDQLNPGDNKRIETEVFIPSATVAQTSSLGVTVTYFDESSWLSQTETQVLSFLLRGSIDMSFTDFAVIPSTPRSGSPFSITITVTNLGTSTGYAAYAIPALEGLPLTTFGLKQTYVGNIEANLPTTFTVNLQLEETSLTNMTLPITLSYMDNLRAVHEVTFEIPITVAPPTANGNQTGDQTRVFPFMGLGLGVAIATIIIIAVVILYVTKWRKRR